LLLCAKDLFVAAIRHRTEDSEHLSRLLRALGFKTLIYLKGFGVAASGVLVSTSKVLAQMNKT